MSDLAFRLRAEARAIPVSADAGLVARIRARLPLALPPVQPRLRFPIRLAAAALLVASLSIAWVALAGDVPPPRVQATAMPAPPTLGEMLGQARAGLPRTAVEGELSALGADLAAVAQTVRSAVPF